MKKLFFSFLFWMIILVGLLSFHPTAPEQALDTIFVVACFIVSTNVWSWFWFKYHEWRLGVFDLPFRRYLHHVDRYVHHGKKVGAHIRCY